MGLISYIIIFGILLLFAQAFPSSWVAHKKRDEKHSLAQDVWDKHQSSKAGQEYSWSHRAVNRIAHEENYQKERNNKMKELNDKWFS